MRGIRTRAGALISAEVVKLVPPQKILSVTLHALIALPRNSHERALCPEGLPHLSLLLGDSAHSHHREHSQDSPICMRVCRWKKLLAGLNGPEIHLSPHHRAWRFYPLVKKTARVFLLSVCSTRR